MLCGNPDMVSDLRQQLGGLGFKAGRRGQPGNLVVENYW
jgi:ferredoxin--NADP+ reductase